MDDGAVAHYQGLLLSTQHRMSSHYTMLANFTDSYCLSDYDFGAALAGSTNSQVFNRHADWGPCVSDARYLFNASLVATSSWHRPAFDHRDGYGQLPHRPQQRPAEPGAGQL
jgi:hypothetical protein